MQILYAILSFSFHLIVDIVLFDARHIQRDLKFDGLGDGDIETLFGAAGQQWENHPGQRARTDPRQRTERKAGPG